MPFIRKMSTLPSDQTPLNQHSLRALEQWLSNLGAVPVDGDPCRWTLTTPRWTAELEIDREELNVIWQQQGRDDRRCSLPYGLSRADVEAAIQVGP